MKRSEKAKAGPKFHVRQRAREVAKNFLYYKLGNFVCEPYITQLATVLVRFAERKVCESGQRQRKGKG